MELLAPKHFSFVMKVTVLWYNECCANASRHIMLSLKSVKYSRGNKFTLKLAYIILSLTLCFA